MILRKSVAPKRANFAKSHRIRDIEAPGRPLCPILRERRFANVNARPIIHRNGLQARHSYLELLIKGFVVNTGIDLGGVEMLMSKDWYVSYLSFWSLGVI
jgi:hypothetical protein